MDPVTHTLVGVALGNGVFRRRAGKAAVPILALASNLPDVDALMHLTGDPGALLMRRTYGHGLVMVPLWSLGLAVVLRRFCPGIRFVLLLMMVLTGAGVHLFFDLVNSFGVVLLWPFSDWRPELAVVFIIDLVLTGLLAAPLLICAGRRMRRRLVPISRLSLAAVAIYVAICGAGRMAADRLMRAEATARGDPAAFTYVFPEPLGPHRWHGVLREGEAWREYLVRPIARAAQVERVTPTLDDDPRVQSAQDTATGRRLGVFFKAPVWQVAPDGTVTARDLRFSPLVLERDPVFVFSFPPSPGAGSVSARRPGRGPRPR